MILCGFDKITQSMIVIIINRLNIKEICTRNFKIKTHVQIIIIHYCISFIYFLW